MSIPTKILQYYTGNWIAQTIRVSAQFCLLDQLLDGVKSANEVAKLCQTNPEATFRILRTMASLGFATMDDGEKFAISEMGKYITKDYPDSVRGHVLLEAGEVHTKAWQNVDHFLKTGEGTIPTTFGVKDYWGLFEKFPSHTSVFQYGMQGNSRAEAKAIVNTLDLSHHKKLIDIGAGDGTLLISLLIAFPNLHGVFFDLSQSCEIHTKDKNVGARYDVVPGNFMESVPTADAYVLKHILHDWNDQHSVQILNIIRKSIAPGGKVYIIDTLVEPGDGPQFAKLLDLHMAVVNNAKERTEAEFRKVFEQAEFKLDKIHVAGSNAILEISCKN